MLSLLTGYLFLDRAFAHLHIPGTPTYFAEPILAAGLVLAASSIEGRRLVKFSTPIRFLLGFMVWGLLLMAFHVFDYGLDALQDSALWYYGLFAIVVGAVVLTQEDALERLIPIYAGGLGVFAVVAWVRLASATSLSGPFVPDSTVPWTGHRQGNIAIHAAVGFAFAVLILAPYLAERMERARAIAWTAALAVPLLVLYFGAGTQNRGGLVAGFFFIVGVPMVARNFGPAMAAVALAILALFAALYISDVSVDLGRQGRPLSVRTIVENIVSVREGEDTGRTDLWDPVIDDILTQEHFLVGLGFGENLGERYDFKDLEALGANPLRNVHNSHLNVLARMGVIGVGFWIALWGVWYYHLYRARSRLRMVDSPRRAAWLGWAMLAATAMLTNAFFDGTLEGPQVAVWLWSVFGLGAAIAMETNIREWRRRRTGGADIVREGGGANPLEMDVRQLKKASKKARRSR
ncbi:MAG: O-antigen ligase family protein [Acidimicrobiia bacterium]|nr:O-antigen ligase family protein [Acidimicrobiia bacterium]